MANVLADLFQDTANAIREKTGDAGTMKPAEFPDKIRAIETGGDLVPLVVTENGTYYPLSSFEFGKSYTFKASYTQEDLQTLAALGSSPDGLSNLYEYGDLFLNTLYIGNVRVLAYNVSDTEKYFFTEEANETLGLSVGWNAYGADGAYTVIDTPPSITFEEAGTLYISDSSAIPLLFNVVDCDGFSSVSVNVESGGGSVDDAVVWAVKFIGSDGSTIYEKYCLDGDDCYDPIITEKIETPTKESTAQYNFAYNGWSLTDGGTADENALSAVASDRTVYAAFAENIRYYTVNFYDGETLMKTESVAYGSQASPPDTEKGSGYAFEGWTPSDLTITGDTDFYGSWKESEKLAAYTWEEIAAFAESGEAATKFAIGDTKDVTLTYESSSTTNTMQLVAFNHDTLSDGTGKAGMTFVSTEPFGAFATNADIGGSDYVCYNDTGALKAKVKQIYETYTLDVYSLVKTVDKITTVYNGYTNTTETTQETIWIPSVDEMGLRDLNSGEAYEMFTDDDSRAIGYECWLRDGANARIKLYTLTATGGYSTKYVNGSTYTAYVRWGFCL